MHTPPLAPAAQRRLLSSLPHPARQGRFHFVSTDFGASFKALPAPGGAEGFGNEIRPHPRQPDWLLAKVRRNECIVDRRR